MPLEGKYLKYSPEITPEIFTLVWDKLINLGWTDEDNTPLNKAFLYFSTTHNYFKSRYKKVFNQSRVKQGVEITVQEILGYDPFIKDDFVLPDKWCIKCTPESKESLDKWTGFSWQYDYIYFDGKYKTWSNTLYNDYAEITFEQFKKYVLKESIETLKEVIPKYVELLEGFDSTCTGKIFDTNQPIPQMSGWINQWTWESIFKNDIQRSYFKSSTKEAFDAQNKPIEKWSIGSYVVFLKKLDNKRIIGFIDKIISKDNECVILELSLACAFSRETKNEIKWFATKSEAEEFAKTLVESVKEDIKQSLKQAVHCATQEEWDFVTEKLGYKWCESKFENYKKNSCIGIQVRTNGHISSFINYYQILSFQEWCDLNGYKMKKEVKFEVGKWYKAYYAEKIYFLKYKNTTPRNGYNQINYSEFINNGVYKINDSISNTDLENSFKVLDDLEEIHQYLPDGHPDLIKTNQEFKVGEYIFVMIKDKYYGDILKVTSVESDEKNSGIKGTVWIKHENSSFSGGGFRLGSKYRYNEHVRHATPEEINNHLISIGQISDLGNQEPQKYSFKPLQPNDLEWEVQISNPYSEVLIEQSNGKLDKSLSIFPTFEENPLIQITEFEINKNYFIDFKDPYN